MKENQEKAGSGYSAKSSLAQPIEAKEEQNT